MMYEAGLTALPNLTAVEPYSGGQGIVDPDTKAAYEAKIRNLERRIWS